jgi:hypothetical protein
MLKVKYWFLLVFLPPSTCSSDQSPCRHSYRRVLLKAGGERANLLWRARRVAD